VKRVAALAVALLAGCARSPRGPAPVMAPLELSVMSFNIRYGTADDGPDAWANRRAQLFALLRRESPDVLGVQEALRFQLDEIHRALPGYSEGGVGRDDGRQTGEYAAILFRTDRFDFQGSATFWLSDTPDVPGSRSWGNQVTRIATSVQLRDRGTRRRLAIYNTHLDHESQNARERSVELLLQRMRDHGRFFAEPVILTGDFNAGEDNTAVAALRRAGWRDSYRVLHPDERAVGTYHAFRGDSTGDKVDYVWVQPSAQVLDARIVRDHEGGRYPSDHFPVLARIRLRN